MRYRVLASDPRTGSKGYKDCADMSEALNYGIQVHAAGCEVDGFVHLPALSGVASGVSGPAFSSVPSAVPLSA